MDQVLPTGGMITLVHFVHQVDPERIACMPNMAELGTTPHHPNYQRSNDTRAVSCPACKRSVAYKVAHERLGAALRST